MGKKYQHLSKEERDMITVLKAKDYTLGDIADELGRDKSTISRELQRNAPEIHKGYYLSHKAQERARSRWVSSHHRPRLKNQEIRDYVEKNIKAGLSPELISGRWRLGHPGSKISHEAIYQYIYEDRTDLIKYLVRAHKKRKRRGYSRKHKRSHIPNRIPIEERPAIAGKRVRVGDWEADTVVSKKSTAALQVLGDRASRLVKIRKIKHTTSEAARKAITEVLGSYPIELRQTITFDNGHENVEHERINEKLGTDSFFCNPYHSWEKGTVENLVGLIRRYLPKGTNFAKISDDRIAEIEHVLNSRPKKCLGFRTPLEAFNQLAIVALAG
jgi:IS30 family transposase